MARRVLEQIKLLGRNTQMSVLQVCHMTSMPIVKIITDELQHLQVVE
jgi:hypothetical protein